MPQRHGELCPRLEASRVVSRALYSPGSRPVVSSRRLGLGIPPEEAPRLLYPAFSSTNQRLLKRGSEGVVVGPQVARHGGWFLCAEVVTSWCYLWRPCSLQVATGDRLMQNLVSAAGAEIFSADRMIEVGLHAASAGGGVRPLRVDAAGLTRWMLHARAECRSTAMRAAVSSRVDVLTVQDWFTRRLGKARHVVGHGVRRQWCRTAPSSRSLPRRGRTRHPQDRANV